MWEWFHARYSVEALWSAWGAIVLGYFAFLILERLVPAGRNPNARQLATDVRANLLFILLNPLAVFAGALLSSPVAAFAGGPQFRLEVGWLAFGPIASFALAFAPFFVFDFFYYWFHRLQHRWLWLWEVHRLHHSESALNAMTNYRHHWLEEFFRTFFILLPMNWLIAVSPVQSAAAALVIRQWSTFFHSNVRLGFGPLTGVVCGPQYHRIHHSIETKHVDRNFAAFFPLWDALFGTYWRPSREEWPETGLSDTDGVWTVREMIFGPFVAWSRRLRSG